MTSKNRLAEGLIKVAQDTKATDIRGYELDKDSGIAELVLIMNANNSPHQSALVRELKKELTKSDPEGLPHSSGSAGSGWQILEWNRTLIHIFTPEIRDYFDIDEFYRAQAKIVHY